MSPQEQEKFPDVATADKIKTIVLEGICEFDSVKDSPPNIHGINNFRQVEPRFLIDLFNNRALGFGLSLSEYRTMLESRHDQDTVDSEMHYFESLVVFEGTTGIGSAPLEDFLGRSPACLILKEVFTRKLDSNSKGNLNFIFYALGDGNETVATLDLIDTVLDDLAATYSPVPYKDQRSLLADNLGLAFRLYDVNAGVLNKYDNVVSGLATRYPWFQDRVSLSFRNILDYSITEDEESAAAIFARNIFTGKASLNGKRFFENALTSLLNGGLLLTDRITSTAIQINQRENLQLQDLKLIYAEDLYGAYYDIRRSAALFRLDKS